MTADLMSKRLIVRAAAGLILILVLGWFAHAHSSQTVDLRFGLFTLRGVSLAVALYGAVVVGMLLMLAASLRGDLRARQALRRPDSTASEPRSAKVDKGLEKAERRST